MSVLIHLADEREFSSIKKNGIKIGRKRQGVFCMPVLPNFYISHQWLRELKRNGAKTLVGIYFKLDNKTKVYAGRYNESHRHIELGEAIKEIQTIDDPLGYELIVDRKIEAKEVFRIKHLPQNIGWRYKPDSNGEKPCGCDYCIKGTIKGNKIRQKYDPREILMPYDEILSKLKDEKDVWEIENLLWAIGRRVRKSDPNELSFLLNLESDSINQELAITLSEYRHKNTKPILISLLETDDKETKEYTTKSLLKLYKEDAIELLHKYSDQTIHDTLNNWLEEKRQRRI